MNKNELVTALTAGLARVERGWCQGGSGYASLGEPVSSVTQIEDGNFCSVCAASAVLYDDECIAELFETIQGHKPLPLQRTSAFLEVACWNDRIDRTWGEVIKLYQDTIARVAA